MSRSQKASSLPSLPSRTSRETDSAQPSRDTDVTRRGEGRFWHGLGLSMLATGAALAWLFRESFRDGMAHFSNDGPLGVMYSAPMRLPEGWTGMWNDLSWLGAPMGSAPMDVSYLLIWLLGPVGFAKFYPPLCLWLLSGSAWIFFRVLGLRSGLCVVTAMAAALNGNMLSNACWGLGTRALTLMWSFLALAVLRTARGNAWLKAALAGLCVGQSILEGADNGAIFSLFVGAFIIFQSFEQEPNWRARLKSALRLPLVAGCAAAMAVQVLIPLLKIAARGHV